ncbi:uncharacterized protein [Coffea arabica]|uniref:Uncharacterized protein isoform X3 n=1 Tax=Coffea arabica TaxID=13443 RepID=A0ABM4VT89_COFAR
MEDDFERTDKTMEGTDSQSTPTNEGSASKSSSENVRQKTDIAWRYAIEGQDSQGRRILICQWCSSIFRGGGINRVKHHLAKVKGNVAPCKNVPNDVQQIMEDSLNENVKKAKEKKGIFEIGNPLGRSVAGFEDDDIQEIPHPKTKTQTNMSGNKGKRKAHGIESYMTGKSLDHSQPSIKSCMQSKERWHDTDMAIALWFYDACIPMNACNSPYYQQAIGKITSMGHGYQGPSYHALRVTLLKDAKKQVELIVDNLRSKWAETGCTIMGDGWKDNRQRSLINFLVYCPSGISFIKSVDASDFESNAEYLCNLFSEIVEIVGSSNVVHMVTDNASNYKAAGRLLSEKYPTISWSPCAAHCLNLIMKDIGEMTHVKDVITLASRVTVYVHNRKWILSWLRKRPGWREILRPAETRFGTNFIALKNLHDLKQHLEALVTSSAYKRELKNEKGKEVKQIVVDGKFWNNCLIIVRIMGPIMRLLRICDSDEKPSLGYVYEGMWRVVNGIKELFKNKKKFYGPYIDIIDRRWDNMLKKDLHAAAFWLNPAFQYDKDSPCHMPEIMKSVLEVMQKLKMDGLQYMMDEISMFRSKDQSFGFEFAQNTHKTARPDEWWKLFGNDAPHLQKLAIKLLSQTSSSSGCERNWSVFERIHTKKRNRLEHQRLSYKKRSYDPVDYETIDKVEFWVIDEEQEGELDYDELEEMIEEEFPKTSENEASQSHKKDTNIVQLDDEDDVDDIDFESYEIGDKDDEDEDEEWLR